jgi:trans-aconitate methyltransferase
LTLSAQQWDAVLYDAHHRFIPHLGERVVDMLRPQAGEMILDLGCGTGDLTDFIRRSGAEVLGVDAAPEMIAAARGKFPEIDFVLGDVLALESVCGGRRFDAVFSNAVLHWVIEAERALVQIAAVLNSGGRLVLEMGAAHNVECIRRALINVRSAFGLAPAESPWYFPSLSAYCTAVEACGLRVQEARHFARPTPLESACGIRYWMEMFAGSFMADLSGAARDLFLDAVEDRLRADLYREGRWWVDYWRLQVVAYKE